MFIASKITQNKDINCYDTFEKEVSEANGKTNFSELKLLKKNKVNPILVLI